MKGLVVVGLSLALSVAPTTQIASASSSQHTRLSYHWPVKPFNQQHPVRGAFGDPRIVSPNQPFGYTGPGLASTHSFHNGIDIVAKPGTPAYPVVSGRVTLAKSGEIVIHTYDGRSFQYYHLSKAHWIRTGRRVVAYRTILGWIRVRYGHLHLAEIDRFVVHNPLDRGHLGPYRDRFKPKATDLWVEDGPVPSELNGRAVGPGDELAVEADDPQAMNVSGPWFGLPLVPALVEWRLFHGRTHTLWKVSADFRHTEPPRRDFWDIYGAGTYQNSPQFNDHIYLGTGGRYLFRLDIRPGRMAPGLYQLTVLVADISGNRSTASWPLQIVH